MATTALQNFMNSNPGFGPVESAVELLSENPRKGFVITPADGADMAQPTKRIYVGVTGDIKVDMVDGGTVTFKAVPVGFQNIQAKRVYSTGTAATNLIGLY